MPHFTLLNDPVNGPVLTAMVGVSGQRAQALKDAGEAVPDDQTIRALVDTGASCTCVDPTVLATLGLTPTGSMPMLTPSSGGTPEMMDQYDVGLLIHGLTGHAPLFRDTIPVVASDLSAQGIDALIGRDVLDECVLVYNGALGQFTLAF